MNRESAAMRRLTPAQWDAAQRRLENGRRQHEAMMNRAKCECGAPVMRHSPRAEWVHIGPCPIIEEKS
jgi:hypothetical protein